MVSVLVGVVSAAGSHLLWLERPEPGDADTALALSPSPGPGEGEPRGGGGADTATTTPTSSDEPSPTTSTTGTTPAEPTTSTAPETTSSETAPETPDATRPETRDEEPDPTDETPRSEDTPSGSSPEREVVRLVNAERARAGCGPVRPDGRLASAAQAHSDDMAERDYLSHTSPDGRTFDERIEDAGYPRPAAENIAMGLSSARAVMDAWMGSSGHRENILNCDIAAIGVGLNSSGWYWTQTFGY